MAATQHYALKPKSDLILLYGIANLLIERGWINPGYIAAHTTGYDGFAGFVKQFSQERVAAARAKCRSNRCCNPSSKPCRRSGS